MTLNSLIAACLLLWDSEIILIQEMVFKTTFIYEYLKSNRSAPTFMQTKPTQSSIEKHIEGLGLKLLDKGKKTSRVVAKLVHQDQKLRSSLAYYSLQLSSVLISEYCFAYFLLHYFRNQKEERIQAELLFNQTKQLANFLTKEHGTSDIMQPKACQGLVKYLSDRKVICYDS